MLNDGSHRWCRDLRVRRRIQWNTSVGRFSMDRHLHGHVCNMLSQTSYYSNGVFRKWIRSHRINPSHHIQSQSHPISCPLIPAHPTYMHACFTLTCISNVRLVVSFPENTCSPYIENIGVQCTKNGHWSLHNLRARQYCHRNNTHAPC